MSEAIQYHTEGKILLKSPNLPTAVVQWIKGTNCVSISTGKTSVQIDATQLNELQVALQQIIGDLCVVSNSKGRTSLSIEPLTDGSW